MTIPQKPKTERRSDWLIDLLLVIVILVGGYFRL